MKYLRKRGIDYVQHLISFALCPVMFHPMAAFQTQGTSLLCYLPTGLYLLIVGIASVRTILDDTFSLQAAVLLLTGLLILLAAGLIPRLLDRRQPPSDNKKQPPSRRIESTI